MGLKILPVKNINMGVTPSPPSYIIRILDSTLGHPKIAPFKLQKVNSAVWRGSNPSAEDIAKLSQKGIKTILNLRTISGSERKRLTTEAAQYGINYINIPINPLKIHHHINYITDLINQASEESPLFVHCTFGRDRTGFVIALARHIKEEMPISDAIAEMFQNGFRKSLYYPMLNYLKRLNK